MIGLFLLFAVKVVVDAELEVPDGIEILRGSINIKPGVASYVKANFFF